nr:sigma-70 family RNA polymerase sigma factor [Paenibacillus sp. GSMTC-2017]
MINRNEKAISFVIGTYGGLLSSIIKHHVHYNQQEYEECLDDVLLAVWQHIGAFDVRKNTFKQWIAAIAKNRAIDYQRKMIRSGQKYVSAEITDDLYNKHNEHNEQSKSPDQDIEKVLDHLSETERTIFEKYYLEGVSSRDMAQQMNVKESWIYNKLSRGRKKIKQAFIPKNEV